MMQLYGTVCALHKEALSLISAPKTKGKGEGGKETNHTGLIELSTCGLYESKLLKRKKSSNMNTEDNTEQFLILILYLTLATKTKNGK